VSKNGRTIAYVRGGPPKSPVLGTHPFRGGLPTLGNIP
jgi:hypothetical protein